MELYDRIQEAVSYIQERITEKPSAGVICGTGM